MVSASWLRENTYRVVVAVTVALLFALLLATQSALLQPSNAEADFRCPSYEVLQPASGATIHQVVDQNQLAAALKAAEAGDTINLETAAYSEIQFRAEFGHRSGTSGRPIVIQAAPGASPTIDPGAGSLSDKHAVAVVDLEHVIVRGLEIRHGLFGVVASGAKNITLEHNDVHDVGLAGIVANSSERGSGLQPSRDIAIRCNQVHHTGRMDPEYGEGIYLGSGATGVVDATSDVVIEGNEIFLTSNEAIDVKRHVTDVAIRHNQIHDVSPYYGGAISLGLNKNSWGPANYIVEYNKIWAVRSGLYYAQAIAVAHGPTTIRHNVIWDIETSASNTWPWTAPIQVHGDDSNADWAYGFGNPSATAVSITDNTIVGCVKTCISSVTDPGQIQPDLTIGNNTVDRASTGETTNSSDRVVATADFIGPTTGTADQGTGPGSGLQLRQSAPATASSTTTTSPTTTLAPTTIASPKPTSTTLGSTTLAPTSQPPSTQSTSTQSSTTTPTTDRPPPTSTPPTSDERTIVTKAEELPIKPSQPETTSPDLASGPPIISDENQETTGVADEQRSVNGSVRSWSKRPPMSGRGRLPKPGWAFRGASMLR